PSLTLMRTLVIVPTSESEGVPLSVPFDVLNVAHRGRFATANVRRSPSASEAVGWKTYCSPTVTMVGGVPAIVGAVLGGGGGAPGGGGAGGAEIMMRKGPMESVASPS